MRFSRFLSLVALLGLSVPALAQEQEYDSAELSNKLANPVASLISIPIEYNMDADQGPNEDGEQWSVKFTPVVPFKVGDNWNLITRTIFSYVDQDLPHVGLDETGISDIALSLYFSPSEIGDSGIIWGVGPLLVFNSATEDSLGAGRWGAGPAAVALKQMGPWTIGGLTSYTLDAGGDSDRSDIESLFFQPFLSYTMANGKTSWTVQSEITRDLENYNTRAFALFQLNQMFTVGKQIMQGRIGVKHWVESEQFGPDSTELNLRLTFLFPK